MLRILFFFWIWSRSPSPATHPHTNFIITAVVRPRTWRTRCFNICLNDKLIWLKLHLFLDARPVSVESYESHRKPHDARWKSYEVNRKTYGIIRKFYKIIWNPYDIQKYARMYYNRCIVDHVRMVPHPQPPYRPKAGRIGSEYIRGSPSYTVP